MFAVQVMLVHVFHHLLGLELPLLHYFPGVPAFFFISGFLIYASWQKSASLQVYFMNRFLRLAPALWVVTGAAVLLILYAKGGEFIQAQMAKLIVWFIAQISLGQAYNPAILRDIGVGVLNGSLWTITVEILFYLMVPVIAYLERFVRHLVPILLMASFCLYAGGESLFSAPVLMGKSWFDFLSLTPLVWGWMFLSGILAYQHFALLMKYVRHFFWALVPLLILILLNADNAWIKPAGNHLGLVYFVLYALLILYVAFAMPYLPLGFDLSYGIYIWHMIVVNAFLVLGWLNPLLAALLTVAIALGSWFFVERPALRLKKSSIRAA